MRLIFKILIGFVIAFLAFVGILAYSASKLEVVSADFSGLGDLSFSGATIEGEIEVFNGGLLPARVDRIEAEAYFEDVSGLIARAEVTGGSLMPKESKVFPFTLRIEWVPSLDTAVDLFFSEKTTAVVNGTVHLVEMGLVSIDIPFVAVVNLEGYIEQFIPDSLRVIPEGVAGDVAGILGDIMGAVSEGVKDSAGAVGKIIG